MKNPGPGGESSITGQVKHHSACVPHTQVYIKYGEYLSRTPNIKEFDAFADADKEGFFSFEKLMPGEYYLYSIGYDSASTAILRGGMQVSLCDEEAILTEIQVSE